MLKRQGVLMGSMVAGFLASGLVGAADLQQKSIALCEHVRGCMMAELDSQNLEPDMRAMMAQAMGPQMCQGFFDANQALLLSREHQDLLTAAETCIDSMLSLSCQQLTGGNPDTPACEAYQRRLESSQH